jgi:hypothetical protein
LTIFPPLTTIQQRSEKVEEEKKRMSHRWCWKRLLVVCLLLGSPALFFNGCVASKQTNNLVLKEGPLLNKGRMSASLGVIKLPDGRVAVIGGSPTEFPFVPHTGKDAIEILDADLKTWTKSSLSLPYPVSGQAFLLKDGRVLVFNSVFILDVSNDGALSKDGKKPPDSAGPVSALILDLNQNKLTPIYRPVGNKGGAKALVGNGVALMQRTFERAIQLKDGRIVRFGGYNRYQAPHPVATCEKSTCVYQCSGNACATQPKEPAYCKEDKDCPKQWSKTAHTVHDVVEVFTPPSGPGDKGSVKAYPMDFGRSAPAAVELSNGQLLLTGGWGPRGEGSNQAYKTAFLFDPNTGKRTALPAMSSSREDHEMSVLKDGRVLITGGTNGNGLSIDTTEYFHPDKKLFTLAPRMSFSRADHIALNLGPWVVFIGGEIKQRADRIRNTAEAFDRATGQHVGHFFLFTLAQQNNNSSVLEILDAGISDFAAVNLSANKVLLLGGQQGRRDPDGEFISNGRGSRRTLIIEYNGNTTQ